MLHGGSKIIWQIQWYSLNFYLLELQHLQIIDTGTNNKCDAINKILNQTRAILRAHSKHGDFLENLRT